MRYLFAIIMPPIAVLSCGKPIQFLLSIILTLCLWIPGMIHAICVVNSYNADQRTDRVVKAIGHQARTQAGTQTPKKKVMIRRTTN